VRCSGEVGLEGSPLRKVGMALVVGIKHAFAMGGDSAVSLGKHVPRCGACELAVMMLVVA